VAVAVAVAVAAGASGSSSGEGLSPAVGVGSGDTWPSVEGSSEGFLAVGALSVKSSFLLVG
jgi:hypothetical protein